MNRICFCHGQMYRSIYGIIPNVFLKVNTFDWKTVHLVKYCRTVMLLMMNILPHVGCIKTLDKLPTNWSRNSSVNSVTFPLWVLIELPLRSKHRGLWKGTTLGGGMTFCWRCFILFMCFLYVIWNVYCIIYNYIYSVYCNIVCMYKYKIYNNTLLLSLLPRMNCVEIGYFFGKNGFCLDKGRLPTWLKPVPKLFLAGCSSWIVDGEG